MKAVIGRGFASGFAIDSSMSRTAVRRGAQYTRPDTRVLPWTPAAEYGMCVGRRTRAPGAGRPWARIDRRRRLFGSLEEVVLVEAIPRSRKTPFLAEVGRNAPGAAVFTSTKPDLYGLLEGLRPGPDYVFNPEGIEGVPTNLYVDLVAGCHRPKTAAMTAGYLINGAPHGEQRGDERVYWNTWGATLLGGFLLAAAIDGRSMEDVFRWVLNDRDTTAVDILKSTKWLRAAQADQLHDIYKWETRPRGSVFTTARSGLGFMADDDLARYACPGADDPLLDVPAFLDERGSLHLVGTARDGDGGVSSLFAAITGRLIEEGKALADSSPSGRLDPPLTFVLDEVTGICRLPLPTMAGDLGGRGMPLVFATHSRAAMVETWGDAGTDRLVGNCGLKLVFGAGSDVAELRGYSDLGGTRYARKTSLGPSGVTAHADEVPVLTSDAIHGLPPGRAALYHRNNKPVIVDVPSIRDSAAYRKAHR